MTLTPLLRSSPDTSVEPSELAASSQGPSNSRVTRGREGQLTNPEHLLCARQAWSRALLVLTFLPL